MKHILTLLVCLTATIVSVAQPKEAWKATATLNAYDIQGQQVYSGNVFFVNDNGTIVAPYTPFVTAVRAEVIASDGKRYEVTRILGATENYGFALLATDARQMKGLTPIADSTQTATAGSRLYLVGHLRTKKEAPIEVTVTNAQRYDAAQYYKISLPGDAKYVGLPLVDATGRVVAIVGQHAGEAFDVRFATTLRITANSAFDRDLRSLPMPKALPESAEEAMKYITLLEAVNTDDALTAMNDYVAAYPQDALGYLTRANRLAILHRYNEAEQDFNTALKYARTGDVAPDNVHYGMSKSIYAAVLNDSSAINNGWTLQRALQEAEEAYRNNPLPLYVMQQGSCLYAMERYQEAYEKYMEVSRSEIASDETFYTAMLALERAGGDSTQILALMDSVIVRQQRPYSQRAASFFLERAQRLVAYGQYRKAVADFNEFERIIGPRNLTDTFYFMREQAEFSAHMYQQALDDIQSAILSAPDARKPYYQTEEAFIYLACGEYEQAKVSALKAYESLPNDLQTLRILSIAHGELGEKAQALEYLHKAQALGDDSVQPLIEKYQ